MIVLDTNVLSALMRTNPEAAVVEWLDRQAADSVWLTSITVFEARFGLALLPKRFGDMINDQLRRRRTLQLFLE